MSGKYLHLVTTVNVLRFQHEMKADYEVYERFSVNYEFMSYLYAWRSLGALALEVEKQRIYHLIKDDIGNDMPEVLVGVDNIDLFQNWKRLVSDYWDQFKQDYPIASVKPKFRKAFADAIVERLRRQNVSMDPYVPIIESEIFGRVIFKLYIEDRQILFCTYPNPVVVDGVMHSSGRGGLGRKIYYSDLMQDPSLVTEYVDEVMRQLRLLREIANQMYPGTRFHYD